MASNTITVNPRKKTSNVVIPRRTVVPSNITQGTVLLQNPLPKYGFDLKSKKTANRQGKKEEKKSETEGKSVSSIEIKSVLSESVAQDILSESENKQQQQQQHQQAVELTQKASELETGFKPDGGPNNLSVNLGEKPVNKVGPITSTINNTAKLSQFDNHSNSGPLTVNASKAVPVLSSDILPAVALTSPNSLPVISSTLSSSNLPQQSANNVSLPCVSHDLPGTGSQSECVVKEAVTAVTESQNDGIQLCLCNCKDKVKHLEEEKQLLRNQLDVQLQVNQELKKLLVASVGEDLQHRVERLTRDKAVLSLEIGDYSKKMVEDYENLDKISIQADMWRSKYLACRVMSDELASSRAFYAMQFQECQMALQQLLSERHELRINLYESYRGLQLIQGAFDPLNSQSSISHNLTSKNILDLARTNQHLVDSIKYRLLPSHVTSTMSKKIEIDWNDYLTPAESHARQLMSREMRPEDFRHMAKPLPPDAMSVERYHPFQNFDNLTFNVCKKCKGDINVV